MGMPNLTMSSSLTTRGASFARTLVYQSPSSVRRYRTLENLRNEDRQRSPLNNRYCRGMSSSVVVGRPVEKQQRRRPPDTNTGRRRRRRR